MAVLGAVGGDSAGGAIADVLGEGSVGGGDLDAAFEGIAGVGVATDANQRTKRGGASGEAATIGGLKTQGGGKVKKAKKESAWLVRQNSVTSMLMARLILVQSPRWSRSG